MRTTRHHKCSPLAQVAIGVPTPPPEFSLFKHAMPADAFYSTVLEAKRWGGTEAATRGVVQRAVLGPELRGAALKEAATQVTGSNVC